jgi:hypothetical protein
VFMAGSWAMAAFEVHLHGRPSQKFTDGLPPKVIDGGVLEVTHPGGGKTLFSPTYWEKVTVEPQKTAPPLSG